MKFSCIIKLQKMKKHVVYVNGGRAIATVSIQKIQSDYGGKALDKGILEKLKREGKGLTFYIATNKLKP